MQFIEMLRMLLSEYKGALFLFCGVETATAYISTSKEILQDCPGLWVSEMLTPVGSFWVSVKLFKHDVHENVEIYQGPYALHFGRK